MDELLLNFLGREREKTVRIGERTCAMRLLSARETLSLRREIAQPVLSAVVQPRDHGIHSAGGPVIT